MVEPLTNNSPPKDDAAPEDSGSEQLAQLLGMAPAPKNRIGDVIDGRYEVLSELGRGGFGVVYRAKQLNVKREVALKLLHSNRTRDPNASSRFEREMETTAQLEHPNIVRVYDVGVSDDGDLYMAMHLLDGQSLEHVLREGDKHLRWDRVVSIAIQVCRALVAAHQAGIVHRDLKPSNVMLRDVAGQKDVVSVLDFGLAAYASRNRGNKKITNTGVRVGTPTYCAPEQAQSGDVDVRADLYSLGVMLYQMVVGEPPFTAITPVALMYEHAHTAPIPPSQRDGKMHVPPELELLILELLAKAPEDRPASPGVVLERLQAMLKPPAPPRVTASNEWLGKVTIAAGAALVAVAVMLFTFGGDDEAQAPQVVLKTEAQPESDRHREEREAKATEAVQEVSQELQRDNATKAETAVPRVVNDPRGLKVLRTILAPRVSNKEPVGAAPTLRLPIKLLHCHITVKTNFKRRLRLVLKRDGEVVSNVRKMDIGRSTRWRTWAKFKVKEPGEYSCEVRNGDEQLLGVATVSILSGP